MTLRSGVIAGLGAPRPAGSILSAIAENPHWATPAKHLDYQAFLATARALFVASQIRFDESDAAVSAGW